MITDIVHPAGGVDRFGSWRTGSSDATTDCDVFIAVDENRPELLLHVEVDAADPEIPGPDGRTEDPCSIAQTLAGGTSTLLSP